MMARRIAALAGAIVMIAAAWVLRGVLDDGGDSTTVAAGGGSAAERIICEPIVADACWAVFGSERVDIALPGTTLGEFRGARISRPTIWITGANWFDMLNDNTFGAQSTIDPSDVDPLADSPLIRAWHLQRCEPLESTRELLSQLSSTCKLGLDAPATTIGLMARYALFRQTAGADARRWQLPDHVEAFGAPSTVSNSAFQQLQREAGRWQAVIGVQVHTLRDLPGYETVTMGSDESSDRVVIGAAGLGGASLSDAERRDLVTELEQQGWRPRTASPAYVSVELVGLFSGSD